MALQFHINVLAAENVHQLLHRAPRLLNAASGQGGRQGAVLVPGEADQAGAEFAEVVIHGGDLLWGRVFGPAHFHARNQPAEVLVSGARGSEQGDAYRFGFRVSSFGPGAAASILKVESRNLKLLLWRKRNLRSNVR